MPELPEVETVRRSLLASIVGCRIIDVRFGPFTGVVGEASPHDFVARTQGLRFADLRRRAKYLILDLEDETSLLVHLRMTGSLTLEPSDAEPVRFEHLAIALDSGQDLRFADQRKFGRVLHLPAEAIARLDQRLGPEPLSDDFTLDYIHAALRRRSGKIKSVLLDQMLIAGLGNIYVDEALFRARIHPLRAAHRLGDDEIARLHQAIRDVLVEGIVNRGTTFSNFRDGYGSTGSNQSNLRVYGRGPKGQPCVECGETLVRIVVGGRSSHLCPRCQPSIVDDPAANPQR